MLERWEEWAKECFSQEQRDLAPKITYIAEKEWGETSTQAPKDLQKIRENADLTKITRNHPEIETWLTENIQRRT